MQSNVTFRFSTPHHALHPLTRCEAKQNIIAEPVQVVCVSFCSPYTLLKFVDESRGIRSYTTWKIVRSDGIFCKRGFSSTEYIKKISCKWQSLRDLDYFYLRKGGRAAKGTPGIMKNNDLTFRQAPACRGGCPAAVPDFTEVESINKTRL